MKTIIQKMLLILFVLSIGFFPAFSQSLKLDANDYFEKQGVNFLVFSNYYDGAFDDAKISGLEIIHHGVRTVTNGDIRFQATPGQWDAIPKLVKREVDKANKKIEVSLKYPKYDFEYKISVQAQKDGIAVQIYLDKALPEALINKAGFNLEFIPSAYFGKSFMVDGKSKNFPLYPSSNMEKDISGILSPLPLAQGNKITMSPEDNERKIIISSDQKLMLFDGRNTAQNGWFVLRSLIPAGKTGKVLEWYIEAGTIPGWIRKPVIAHSQLGYHPAQKKLGYIELDLNDVPENTVSLIKIGDNGESVNVFKKNLKKWGKYLRYHYFEFDFSDITEEGLYLIQYKDQKTKAFSISKDVYKEAWYPTLDVYMPIAMDHMRVNEAYRVWHGVSHLDDALQAPVNHVHFDLYAQGPTTDSPYKPYEHIPGLNIGGWYDAGDFDIRTQTQYHIINNLVQAYEDFNIQRDETTINQETRYVDMHHPDGKPDIIQQIEHGTLALIAQFRSVGHAIHGIIEPTLEQYTHLGDGSTKTDNLIYTKELDSLKSDGFRSGTLDDRWAFTSKSTALNYGSISALASSYRALKGYNDPLANECLQTAIKVWDDEHSKAPDMFHHGNTTGGPLLNEELEAAIQLFLTTKQKKYSDRIESLWPTIDTFFVFEARKICKVLPFLSKDFAKKFEKKVVAYKAKIDSIKFDNPFGVPITRGGWAGNGFIISFAQTNYALHKVYPKIIDKEYVFKGLNYLYGTHPDSDISFVSGIGAQSKTVAYGNNRADFSFIAGGIVPGILVLKPDFPENKEDWPFFWGENEYVINLGPSYIYLVHAVNDLLSKE